jgi:hypothetical protein
LGVAIIFGMKVLWHYDADPARNFLRRNKTVTFFTIFLQRLTH